MLFVCIMSVAVFVAPVSGSGGLFGPGQFSGKILLKVTGSLGLRFVAALTSALVICQFCSSHAVTFSTILHH